MESDLNKYELEHVCTAHERMSKAEWEAIYAEAWTRYYSWDHMTTLLRRAVAAGLPVRSLIKLLVTFSTTLPIERVHPLQGGVIRLKHPSERRPGGTPMPAIKFWLTFVLESLVKYARVGWTALRLIRTARAIRRDPNAAGYTDLALQTIDPEAEARLELLTQHEPQAPAMLVH